MNVLYVEAASPHLVSDFPAVVVLCPLENGDTCGPATITEPMVKPAGQQLLALREKMAEKAKNHPPRSKARWVYDAKALAVVHHIFGLK